MTNRTLRTATNWTAAAVTGASAGYGLLVASSWLCYGHAPAPSNEQADPLLDRFIPRYDIVERHHIRVEAPADLTLLAAAELDLLKSGLIRGIFRARELALGAEPFAQASQGLLEVTRKLGWGLLAEEPGREIVMGAVTQPWKANVVFRALPPAEFAGFNEPDYVKIAWTLRADPVSTTQSISRTETRAAATDASAREKFRRYWAFVSPGVGLIRWISRGQVKRDAERRFQRAIGRVTDTIVPPPGGTSI